MLMGMGPVGWIISLVLGFVIGGVFFMSMKLQVEYVLKGRGPLWIAPACMYARMILIGVVLAGVALAMKGHREKIPAAMLAAVAAAFVARVLIGRMVGRVAPDTTEEEPHD